MPTIHSVLRDVQQNLRNLVHQVGL